MDLHLLNMIYVPYIERMISIYDTWKADKSEVPKKEIYRIVFALIAILFTHQALWATKSCKQLHQA